jgi:hypothetical protein
MPKPSRAIPIAVAVALLTFLPGTTRAGDFPPVTVQMSTDGSVIVVADSGHNAVSFYRVAGDQVTLMARRDLGGDTTTADEKAAPAAPTPPTTDVPGDDPPGFPRPKRSVRIGTNYRMDSAVQEMWEAYYTVPGSVEDVYAGLRAALKGWTVKQAGVTSRNSSPRGDLRVVNGQTDLTIGVFRSTELPGWVGIQVSEVRRRG